MVTVKKKQSMISDAITITKIKLARVSKPNQCASAVRGSGKRAMTIKIMGSKSQATEFLIDMVLRLRQKIIKNNNANAAMTISI